MNLLKTPAFPALESKRLLLRKPSAKDASIYHHILSCAEVSRYSDIPHQPTVKRSERFVSWMSKLDTRKTGVAWIICLNRQNHKLRKSQLHEKNPIIAKSNVVGSIRINSIEKKARCGMLGYELHPDHWGQGYATEALEAVVEFAHNELALNRLEAWTTQGNSASDRVLIKNGFQHEGTQREKVWLRDAFHHIRLFGRIASDRPSE